MHIQQLNKGSASFPDALVQISDPPKRLFVLGKLNNQPKVAIVGSRRPSSYGREAAYQMAFGLAKRGITVVSGLALGIDSIAHQAALDANGHTVAVLAHGLDSIHPVKHRGLAEQILRSGGALLSEYKEGTPAMKHNFVARNRIVSGISEGLLVIEAGERSGTSITASFALEQGKTVMAIPGSIQSVLSKGTNNLLKAGAVPITEVEDVFHALGYEYKNSAKSPQASNSNEQKILDLIAAETHDGQDILQQSELPTDQFLQTMSSLEIAGIIKNIGANTWILT